MTEERLSLDLIGFDPGSVNLGVGGVRFFGLIDIVNDEGEVIKTIPDIEILAMERWDLERGIVFKPVKSMNTFQKIPLDGHTERSKKMMDWSDSATQAIGRSHWMFAEFRSFLTEERLLPILVIENQCDQHKTNFNKNEMTQIQSILTASLQAIGHRDRWAGRDVKERLYYQGMRKYGQRSDASRDRPERKEKGVDDLKELLSELNTVHSLRWLSYLYHLESKREQIHDMCDAVLLAVDKALTLYEEHLKTERANTTDKEKKEKIQKERKRIPFAPVQKRKLFDAEPEFTDDHLPDQEDCAPPKKRKKRSPEELAEAKAKPKSKTKTKTKEGGEKEKPKKSTKPKPGEKVSTNAKTKEKTKSKKKEPEKEEAKETKTKKRKSPTPKENGEKVAKGRERKRKKEEYPKLLLDVTMNDSDSD